MCLPLRAHEIQLSCNQVSFMHDLAQDCMYKLERVFIANLLPAKKERLHEQGRKFSFRSLQDYYKCSKS